jgi:hypothetical protein
MMLRVSETLQRSPYMRQIHDGTPGISRHDGSD